MTPDRPILTRAELVALVRSQHGVVSRRQLVAAGLPPQFGRDKVRSRRWQLLHRGVYLTNTGVPGIWARAHAALLALGSGAVLAGRLAWYLNGLTRDPPQRLEILVPHGRGVPRTLKGVTVRQQRRPIASVGSPSRTTVEATAFDLLSPGARPDEVVGVLTTAARKLRGLDELRAERARRVQVPQRALVDDLLAIEGLESPLEHRFQRDVVQAHGLPAVTRQAPGTADGAPIRSDVVVEAYRTRIELDGRIHLEKVDDDVWNDNAVALESDQLTLRYRWAHVAGRPCRTARQLERAFVRAGWDGRAQRCGDSCQL